MPKNPDRGVVWLVDLGFAAKVRPCLVLNVPLEDEDRELVTLVPHTTSAYGSRFEVDVPTRFLKTGVFDAQNLVTIPRAKLIRKLGNLSAEQHSVSENNRNAATEVPAEAGFVPADAIAKFKA